jgi:hypothetical protein
VPLRAGSSDYHPLSFWNRRNTDLPAHVRLPFEAGKSTLKLTAHSSPASSQTIANAYSLSFPCTCHSRCCAPFPRSSRARTSRPRTDYTSRNAWRRTTSLAWLRGASSPGRPPWRGSRSWPRSRYSVICRFTRGRTLSSLAITSRFLRRRPQLLEVIIKQSTGYRSGHSRAGTGARCCGSGANGRSRRVERARHGEW